MYYSGSSYQFMEQDCPCRLQPGISGQTVVPQFEFNDTNSVISKSRSG